MVLRLFSGFEEPAINVVSTILLLEDYTSEEEGELFQLLGELEAAGWLLLLNYHLQAPTKHRLANPSLHIYHPLRTFVTFESGRKGPFKVYRAKALALVTVHTSTTGNWRAGRVPYTCAGTLIFGWRFTLDNREVCTYDSNNEARHGMQQVFTAEHALHGKVEGSWDSTIKATSQAVFKVFLEAFPPQFTS